MANSFPLKKKIKSSSLRQYGQIKSIKNGKLLNKKKKANVHWFIKFQVL